MSEPPPIDSRPTHEALLNIINNLIHHACIGVREDAFARKSIESLVRKLKDKRNELDNLITAVTTGGATRTKCVLIQRTLDGRLQVAGRKCFPHIVYCKIWRWPDLTRDELKAVPNCNRPYSEHRDLICVNPYHYDRVIATPGQMDVDNFELHTNEELLLGRAQPENDDDGQQRFPPVPYFPGASCTKDYFPDRAPQSPPPPQEWPVQWQPYYPTKAKLQPDLTHWCSVIYFELDQQVGDTFRAPITHPTIHIDGYTAPCAPDRLCIGFLSTVHRPMVVHRARMHIGKGVKLTYYSNGDVFLENLSFNAVFLSSPYLDGRSHRPYGHSVHKIYHGVNIKVFDLNETRQILTERAEAARQAAAAQAAAVAGTSSVPGGISTVDPKIVPVAGSSLSTMTLSPDHSAIGVDDLRRFCLLNLSFVKGWGLDYKKRPDIKHCPCWVEIHFSRALVELDDVLQNKL